MDSSLNADEATAVTVLLDAQYDRSANTLLRRVELEFGFETPQKDLKFHELDFKFFCGV